MLPDFFVGQGSPCFDLGSSGLEQGFEFFGVRQKMLKGAWFSFHTRTVHEKIWGFLRSCT
jgi:hypothetical protein